MKLSNIFLREFLRDLWDSLKAFIIVSGSLMITGIILSMFTQNFFHNLNTAVWFVAFVSACSFIPYMTVGILSYSIEG